MKMNLLIKIKEVTTSSNWREKLAKEVLDLKEKKEDLVKFIKMFLTEMFDDPCVIRITKEIFVQKISLNKAKKVRAKTLNLDSSDIPINPRQKIYVVADYKTDYPSGGSDWEFQFVFRYHLKYYLFSDCGGS